MDIAELFSEYSISSANHSFHELLHNHHNLSSKAGTLGQQIAAVIVDLVPLQPTHYKLRGP
jgi:hypothetical protein